jgi:hypothetical protein
MALTVTWQWHDSSYTSHISNLPLQICDTVLFHRLILTFVRAIFASRLMPSAYIRSHLHWFRGVTIDWVWIGHWIHWHDSEVQVIKALSLISTIHRSPHHPLSLPACHAFNSRSLATASRAHIVTVRLIQYIRSWFIVCTNNNIQKDRKTIEFCYKCQFKDLMQMYILLYINIFLFKD